MRVGHWSASTVLRDDNNCPCRPPLVSFCLLGMRPARPCVVWCGITTWQNKGPQQFGDITCQEKWHSMPEQAPVQSGLRDHSDSTICKNRTLCGVVWYNNLAEQGATAVWRHNMPRKVAFHARTGTSTVWSTRS